MIKLSLGMVYLKQINKPFIDPFLQILPKLDLHGETSDTIRALIIDFINVNIKLKKYKVQIVHGRHGGILKNKTHEILKKLPTVERYYTYYNNDGVTIVELKNL